jgi:hypothetical protein
MSYAEHWDAIVARVKSLQQAGELYARFQSYHQEDSYGAGRYLVQQCSLAVDTLAEFRRTFAVTLPAPAIASLDHFLDSRLAAATKDGSADHRAARGALVALVGVEAEVSFILAGRQEQIRIRSERALLLLQRLLAVDDEVREKWVVAHRKGELACERLGSIQLLSQGIYAFKVDAAGARTDLVFHEPPNDSLLMRGVEGIVLTEWKIASASNAAAQFAAAKSQADLYKQGALAGAELAGYRYLIAVSLNELPSLPADEVTVEGIIYRHVNIVVAPAVPSKAAKRRASTHSSPGS